MASCEHLNILRRGVEAWNDWRRTTKAPYSPDLSEAILAEQELPWIDLYEADLRWTDLRSVDLGSANLTEAHCARANLSGAELVEANLHNANLARANLTAVHAIGTDFSGANLSNADFTGAAIHDVDFSNADLTNTNFTDCLISFVRFTNVDLSLVKGLESVVHEGPSSLGIDTFFKSTGAIPDAFLRGSGVPDVFIRYAKSLAGSGFDFYSCFISYSAKDQNFAERLYADLQANGVRCWFAPQDMQSGRKVHDQIDEAIRLHDKLLLILSPHSMNSEWVKTEISKARRRETQDKEQVLFPVSLVPFEEIRAWECFDADTGKDSAREVREHFVPDFSNWKDHDTYGRVFNRLLRDLRTRRQQVKRSCR